MPTISDFTCLSRNICIYYGKFAKMLLWTIFFFLYFNQKSSSLLLCAPWHVYASKKRLHEHRDICIFIFGPKNGFLSKKRKSMNDHCHAQHHQTKFKKVTYPFNMLLSLSLFKPYNKVIKWKQSYNKPATLLKNC